MAGLVKADCWAGDTAAKIEPRICPGLAREHGLLTEASNLKCWQHSDAYGEHHCPFLYGVVRAGNTTKRHKDVQALFDRMREQGTRTFPVYTLCQLASGTNTVPGA